MWGEGPGLRSRVVECLAGRDGVRQLARQLHSVLLCRGACMEVGVRKLVSVCDTEEGFAEALTHDTLFVRHRASRRSASARMMSGFAPEQQTAHSLNFFGDTGHNKEAAFQCVPPRESTRAKTEHSTRPGQRTLEGPFTVERRDMGSTLEYAQRTYHRGPWHRRAGRGRPGPSSRRRAAPSTPTGGGRTSSLRGWVVMGAISSAAQEARKRSSVAASATVLRTKSFLFA